MKKIILRTSILFLSMIALISTAAADGPQRPFPLEGVFDSHVILTDCQGHTIADFRAFEMFHRGGTLTSTDNSPPTAHGPGFGTWQHSGGRNYTSLFQFFRFNSDGSFAGVQRIDRTITLAAGGDTYTSVVQFEAIDPNGNVVFTGCGTESATRIQ